MNCINFPKMFSGNSTIIDTYESYEPGNDLKKDPTQLCIELLLKSEKSSMFGDPGFGVKLKYYTFNQNNYILAEILADEIYTQISTFCPQVFLERKDVKITLQENNKIHIKIYYINQLDFTPNTFNLVLKMEDND